MTGWIQERSEPVPTRKKEVHDLFRSPVNGAYSSQQTFDQGTIRPLAFPDVVIAIDQILGR